MRRLTIRLFTLVAMMMTASAGLAADRNMSLMPGNDLPGFDYGVLKGVDLDTCQSTCVGDTNCQAFTFNEKAKWCFLKGSVGDASPFKGATSGIVVQTPSVEDISLQRQRELSFPASGLIDGARSLASGLATSDPAPEGVTFDDLVSEAEAAAREGNAASARVFLRQALGINGNDPILWVNLADTALTIYNGTLNNSGQGDYDLASEVTYAALNSFLRAERQDVRAAALDYLMRGLEGRQMWREAIATGRDSLALVDDAALQEHLDKVVAEHGFRILSHDVDAEAAQPRICATFSEPLPRRMSIWPPMSRSRAILGLPSSVDGSQLCLEGVTHGSRYHISLRAGLPSSVGETLRNTVELDVFVPDRSPFVGFANNAYVMPAGVSAAVLPITSVNATSADIAIYRIGDRAIATAVRDGVFTQTLDGYSAEDIAYRTGQLEFEGQVDLAEAPLNEMAVTAIPVADILTELSPGAYVITAKITGGQEQFWQSMATQWFIVTRSRHLRGVGQ